MRSDQVFRTRRFSRLYVPIGNLYTIMVRFLESLNSVASSERSMKRLRDLILFCFCVSAVPFSVPTAPAQEEPTRGQDSPAREEPTSDQQGTTPSQSQDSPAREEPTSEPPPESQAQDKRVEIRLSLEEVIRMALENNLNVRMARLDEMISEREVVIARSFFDPFFNVSTTFSKNRDPTVSRIDVTGGQAVAVNPSEVTTYNTSVTGTSVLGSSYNLTLQQNQFDRPSLNTQFFSSLNPMCQWVPSQNGLFFDPPQRQSV